MYVVLLPTFIIAQYVRQQFIKYILYYQLYRLTFWTRHSAKIRLELKDEEEESTAELVNNATNPDSTTEEEGIKFLKA